MKKRFNRSEDLNALTEELERNLPQLAREPIETSATPTDNVRWVTIQHDTPCRVELRPLYHRGLLDRMMVVDPDTGYSLSLTDSTSTRLDLWSNHKLVDATADTVERLLRYQRMRLQSAKSRREPLAEPKRELALA